MLKIRHYELPKMINGIYERLFIHLILKFSWWRHEMETFSALLAICAGNSPVPGEFPAQRPVTQSFDVLFDLNGWVNNREVGDLRRHRTHHDVIVMYSTRRQVHWE